MRVTKQSQITGKLSCLEIPITEQQLKDFENRGTKLAQSVLPDVTAEQREFLMTGISPAEWEEYFGEEEE